MPFLIVRNDITKMPVDAIVNAANNSLLGGGGVDGAIHRAAGPQLLAECRTLGGCATGDAKITKGYNLPAKYVIHTVGPVWDGGGNGEEKTLAACYRKSLELALEKGCETVAFPLISSGAYRFPKDRALQIATQTISDFVIHHDITVYLVVFDRNSYVLSEKLFRDIESYIDENYVDLNLRSENLRGRSPMFSSRKKASETPFPYGDMEIMEKMVIRSAIPFEDTDWDDLFTDMDETFSQTLLRLIEARGMTNAQAYKKANIDKKHFAKIKNNKDYHPTKYTVLAFAIALKLNMEETKALMEKAGLALTKSNRFDLIVSFFIENGRYDIFELNDVLFEYDLPLLGC